jgi:hypothetical protein
MRNKQCIVCGRPFTANHGLRKTCSEACWNTHRKQVVRECSARRHYKDHEKTKARLREAGLIRRSRNPQSNSNAHYLRNREEILKSCKFKYKMLRACYELMLEREGSKSKLIQLLKEQGLL